MKKSSAISIFVVVVVGLILVWYFGQKNNNQLGVTKIGADLTLSGDLAYWSTELKKGMDLASSETDSNHIAIVYEDNQGRASDAVNIFKKLVSVDKVSVVLSCFTPIAQPLRPVAGESKVPLVATVRRHRILVKRMNGFSGIFLRRISRGLSSQIMFSSP